MVWHRIILQIQSSSLLNTVQSWHRISPVKGHRLYCAKHPWRGTCFATSPSLFLIHSLSRPYSYQWIMPGELDEINSFSFLICLRFHLARLYFSDDWRFLSLAVIFLSSLPHPLFFPAISFFLTAFWSFSPGTALMAKQSSGVQKGNISWKLERIHPCCYGMNWNLVLFVVLISPFWQSLVSSHPFLTLTPSALFPTHPSKPQVYPRLIHPDLTAGSSSVRIYQWFGNNEKNKQTACCAHNHSSDTCIA